MTTFEERMEALEKAREERESIRCPWCGVRQDNDDQQYPVSYWGSEEGPEKMSCESCEKDFLVKEIVSREYEVSRGEGGR